jgi:hypothetical protein
MFNAVNTGAGNTNVYRAYFGLHDGTAGAEPATGLYFRYRNAGSKAWEAVCANGGSRTVRDTGVDASVGAYSATANHRFRIVCEAGTTTTVRFFIDDLEVAHFTDDATDLNPLHTYTANLPSAPHRYTPAVTIAKFNGTAGRSLKLDYFALRYAHART